MTMSVAELIDAGLSGRVLVYGSLPPDGRDLDLLVRQPQRSEIEELLLQAGFAGRRARFARFARCTAEIVELCDAARWDLCQSEVDALFAQAEPIARLRWLTRPSPHHSLLILARRLVGEQGVLSEKLRARTAQAIEADPLAWQRARSHAEGWRAQRALDALEHAFQRRARAPSRLCAKARRERGVAAHDRGPRRMARLTPGGLRHAARRRVGTVISFSGVDGSGKSSQAAALREVLERLGCEAVVVRTRISWEEWLWAMVPRVKRLIAPFVRALLRARAPIARGGRRGATPAPAAGGAGGAGDAHPEVGRADDPVGRLRAQSALLTDAWTVIITLANAWSQWRLMSRHLLRGSVVICDRYTLDSLVELRYKYGAERPLAPLRTTLARLYPRPARSYFLDVDPHTAFQRKGEWGIAWLCQHRALYLQEHARMGVKLLDGERPREQICAEIARDVWLNGIP